MYLQNKIGVIIEWFAKATNWAKKTVPYLGHRLLLSMQLME
jgi:hypothetical protein